ncbi:MAG: protein kinase domain-containing protein [Prosthecobacter sp.]
MNSELPSCPQCGGALPAGAPQGLCPRCLAALNFATETMLPDAVPVAPQEPLTPEELTPHFPQLEILECLGRGGMGVVYKARQKSLNRLVALKLLAPERADDAKFAARFEKEAQALAALSHPHIVTIHDFGQAGGFYFLLMEFVDGVNLRQAMAAGRFTPEQALAIIPPVCEALQYAHEHGIVHRDIKPENLLLDKAGRVKIADFGIAKMLGAQPPDAADADILAGSRSHPLGTPAYAAPEQQNDPRHVDHRADIYSLGVVLYELLTGELPKGNIGLPARRVQIDVRLEEVVLRALEVRPELRFSTVVEFQTHLAGAVARPPVMAPLPEPRPVLVPVKPPRRWPGVVAMLLGLGLYLGAWVWNEMVDDYGLTSNAREHLERRREVRREVDAAKMDALAKNKALAAAKEQRDVLSVARLTGETQQAQLRLRKAEAAMQLAADLKEGDEKARVAIIYLAAGGLMAVGAVLAFFRVRSGAATRPRRKMVSMVKGLSGALFAWGVVVAFTHVSAEAERLERVRHLQAKKKAFENVLGSDDPDIAYLEGQIAALEGRRIPPKATEEPAAPISGEEGGIRNKIQQLQKEREHLSASLGRKHPRILSIAAQIAALMEQLAQDDQSPVPGSPAGARFITTAGTYPLNKRYTLHVEPKLLKGKDGSSRMRTYSLRSSLDDGTAAVVTYAPLAIQFELFLIYWDRERHELWLASPSVMRWHHLPETGDPVDQVFMRPDIPAGFAARMPKVFAEAVKGWNLSSAQSVANDLPGFLRGPQSGRFTAIAVLARGHYFLDDVPQALDMECFVITEGGEKQHVFVKRGSPLEQKVREQLPWDERRLFTITLSWQQQGSQSWLELLDAELFDPGQKK